MKISIHEIAVSDLGGMIFLRHCVYD